MKAQGKILRLNFYKSDRRDAPVYFEGKQYSSNAIHVGDFIEVRVVAGDGPGEAFLQDMQLLKRESQ